MARSLDPGIDRVLAYLMRRRLYRTVINRAHDSPSQPSSWHPGIADVQERLIRSYAPGRSFADIGCIWGVDGAFAFLAEEAGATRVTAMDIRPRTEAYLAEEHRRSSAVRFVRGDLHKPSTVEEVGVHDVVWCSGVMYHTPHVFLAMEHLLKMCREYLIVGTKGIPSVPGLPGAAVYYPGLDARERKACEAIAGSVASKPYMQGRVLGNWFWGLAPETLAGLARSIEQVELVERVELPWQGRHDDVYLVLRRSSPATDAAQSPANAWVASK